MQRIDEAAQEANQMDDRELAAEAQRLHRRMERLRSVERLEMTADERRRHERDVICTSRAWQATLAEARRRGITVSRLEHA
jgi:hypothetical protein